MIEGRLHALHTCQSVYNKTHASILALSWSSYLTDFCQYRFSLISCTYFLSHFTSDDTLCLVLVCIVALVLKSMVLYCHIWKTCSFCYEPNSLRNPFNRILSLNRRQLIQFSDRQCNISVALTPMR